VALNRKAFGTLANGVQIGVESKSKIIYEISRAIIH
jgi:hypothetical protein